MNRELQSSQKERVGEKLNTTFISNNWIQTKTENLFSYSLVLKKITESWRIYYVLCVLSY